MNGWGPIPRFGLVGIGAATSLVHVGTAWALWALMRHDPVLGALLAVASGPIPWIEVIGLVRLGIPTSLTYGAEAGMFTVLAITAGTFGESALAAHNIVNQITYAAFQVSVGLSHAVSIRISAATICSDARRAAMAGLQEAWLVNAALGISYVFLPAALLGSLAPTSSASVLGIAATLLAICAVNQFADSTQNLAVGMLRGLHRTGASLRASLIGYWCVGVPSALAFAFLLGLGVYGIWIGLGIGLSAAAGLMIAQFLRFSSTNLPSNEVVSQGALHQKG